VSLQLDEPPGAPARRRPRRAVWVSALLAVLVVGGVATWALWPSTPEERLIEALSPETDDGGGGGSYCGPAIEDFGALADLAPNTLYRTVDGTEGVQTDVVLAGRFTAVEPGIGRVVSDDDGANDRAVEFDDPSAMYRTVHAQLVVDTVVAGESQPGRVLVGFLVRGSKSDWDHLPTFEEARDGLPTLGRVVVFLSKDTARYAYDPSVHGVAFRHSSSDPGYSEYPLLGQVGTDGRLDFPMLPSGEAERLTAPTPTLDALVAAGREPERVVPAGDCLRPLDAPP
jgi:hypothetical protein